MSASDWSELDGHEALVSELRANPPVAPERLRQRVLEGTPAPRRQRSRKRRLVLVVVPAAVVLAVGAALVHGFVSSGGNQQQRADIAANEKLYPSLNQTKATGSGKALEGGVAHAKAGQPQNGAFSSQQNSAAVASAPQALELLPGRRAVTIPKNRLVHAVASLQVGVKSSNLSA